ncbi:hypothetical protein ABXK61_16070 [Burkholderia sola]|uniref:hypothetical protein n=1 Tax=Burkholderia TaxID=32008 RepID=UPI001AE701F3|nr:hypothetical protein [Burkholderia sp. AcTa6-5]MBP0714823.1 hypothetical protein [Burkholderia sp. AcTa6-5]
MASKPNGRGGSRPGAGRKPKAKPAEIKPEKNQTLEAPKRRGGARPGAGRKPKSKPVAAKSPVKAAVTVRLEPQAHGGALKRSKEDSVEIAERDMLTLLKDVALGKVKASSLQVRAAIAAVQYTHTKKGDGGKKDEVADAAKRVANRFAPAAPPRLVANGGKKT